MKKLTFLISSLLFLEIGTTHAQYKTLLNFDGTNGQQPNGSITVSASGKVLYGMSTKGGANDSGCVFSIDTNGDNYKDLLDFTRAKGTLPNFSSLTLAGDKLYGMTEYGGADDSGCVFSIDTNGHQYKLLLSFTNANGANPLSSLILSGKVLYGVTLRGGVNGDGCIFSIDTDGSRYKLLQSFNGVNGNDPYGPLTLVGKLLYGMTYGGGAHGVGCIFSIDTNGQGYTDRYDFPVSINNGQPDEGGYPVGALTYSKGMLYGMTYGGGMYGQGVVFSIDTSGHSYQDMHDFAVADGGFPGGSLSLAGNTLYGVTDEAGSTAGNLFSIDTAGSGYKDIYAFTGLINYGGAQPTGSITLSGKMIYGMTYWGGSFSYGYGVVFGFKDDSITIASINEVTATQNSVDVYPNPSNGTFTLSLSDVNGACGVEIYSLLGEQVYHQITNSSNYQIKLSNQPNGVYLYRITDGQSNLIASGKFIIQK